MTKPFSENAANAFLKTCFAGATLMAAMASVFCGRAGAAGAVQRPMQTVADEVKEKLARVPVVEAKKLTYTVSFTPQQARFVRVAINRTNDNAQACLDELEIYGSGGDENYALASQGATASASSLLAGHAIHTIPHLNDGQYGNSQSWIAATSGQEWVQIELPKPVKVAQVVISRDRMGQFRDRIVADGEVLLSMDGKDWKSVAKIEQSENSLLPRRRNPLSQYDLIPTLPAERLAEKNWHGVVEYSFLRERDTWSRIPEDDFLSPLVADRPASPGGTSYWSRVARLTPLDRILVLYEELADRLEAQGLDVSKERRQLAEFKARAAKNPDAAGSDDLYLKVRWAKRELFFRDPTLSPLSQMLFSKRHPFLESHNYSEHLDGFLEPGGGLFVLHIPTDAKGRLEPEEAEIEQIFDGSAGIARDPAVDYDGRTVFFAYRPDAPEVQGWDSYWHLYSLSLDDGQCHELTEGPYHDFDPVVLPDGGIAFNTTRCVVRFLCWRPQAYVLYRMERDGTDIKRLSWANLSEWKPSVMSDGRILWTRSEYLDKGADFGHTLWTIRPDGTYASLLYGNNTPNCYSQAHEIPGTNEILCTLMSHGDHGGPVALIDRGKGPFDSTAITNITPDTRPQYQMSRSHTNTFGDPYPVSKDHFLVSHNPDNHHNWGIYIIDRYGNRELLYVDPEISSQRPMPLCQRPRPPLLVGATDQTLAKEGLGLFTVQDINAGLEPTVPRGRVKYLRVVEEAPSMLQKLPNGQFCNDHPPFTDFYASPIHLVQGPAQSYLTRTTNAPLQLLKTGYDWNKQVSEEGQGLYRVTEGSGWPSYVAKTSHGVVPVEEDGSVNFLAPADKQLYFQALDADFNEIQRMRSVVQLQAGERRSCIGCHENRKMAPASNRQLQALQKPPARLQPPPWGDVPFAYERDVQPVWDRQCVSCHDGAEKSAKPDMRAQGPDNIPASYRSLITGGWVHYFDYTYGMRHFKAEPLSFGTLQSRLWKILADANHAKVHLTEDELRAVKTWIDFNCPLWPDYTYRLDRPQIAMASPNPADGK